MSTNERTTFSSKIGIILAAAGSAVGLGNIWRFPSQVGENGGAAFILIYLLCVIFLGIPVMLSEFIIGRSSAANGGKSFEILAPGTIWKNIGLIGIVSAFSTLCYYGVVSGWTLKYMFSSATTSLNNIQDYVEYFNDFVTDPWSPIIHMIVFSFISYLVISKGVQKGIERYSKILMPILFILICVLVVCSFTMPGCMKGLTFLLRPDFSKVTGKVLLDAMGQAFFSMSVGIGCLVTYASYFRSDANLIKTAGSVALIDSIVAILAGFIIFPAVFSIPGLSVDAGPGLVFITLPNVFAMNFHNTPLIGYIFSLLFYLLLVLAALTSYMSLHEVATAYLLERFQLNRKKAAGIVTVICIIPGVFCALSFGLLAQIKVFSMTIFDFFDFLSAKLLLPLGGMFISIFTGWKLDKKISYNQVTNNGKLRVPIFKFYIFLLKFIAPTLIFSIFVYELIK